VLSGKKKKREDKMIGNGSKKLVDWTQRKSWYILNESTKGDWDGEYTYIDYKDSTVIDYVIVNKRKPKRICDRR